MKKFILFLLVISYPIFAQIPNAGFENWTGGLPDNWLTSNLPTLATNVTQSSDAHSGTSAIKGEVINLMSGPYPPLIQSGSDALGFGVNQRHNYLTGYYKFTSISNDALNVTVVMYKNQQAIGAGAIQPAPASSYAKFEVKVSYIDNTIPDTCIIQIAIGNSSQGSIHVGSYFILDDLAFAETATGIDLQSNAPSDFKLDQNYPNPFNPVTSIMYTIPEESFVKLKIYNMLGNEVASLVNEEKPAGDYRIKFDASNLPSGVYIYRIQAGNFSATKKLMLIK